MQKLWLWSGNH